MILITRPKHEAIKLKKIIEGLGYVAHIDSLSQIINLNLEKNINSNSIILISSQRAAQLLIEKYEFCFDKPLLIIGNSSYKKLKSAGFSKIIYRAKDSNHLIKYLIENITLIHKRYGNELTYITGSVSNQIFIKRLNEIGYKTEKKIIYRTIFKSSFNHSTIKLLKNNKFSICLIFSKKNAEHFCNLVLKENLFQKCNNLEFLTLSKNITHVMKKNGYHKVAHSAQPNQSSLIKKLVKK